MTTMGLRGHGTNGRAILCAFVLLKVNGDDVRREPIEDRKRCLAGLPRLPHDGIALNEHFDGDGAMIFKHACVLGSRVPYRRGSVRPIVPGALTTGSRSRTRTRRRCGGSRRRLDVTRPRGRRVFSAVKIVLALVRSFLSQLSHVGRVESEGPLALTSGRGFLG